MVELKIDLSNLGYLITELTKAITASGKPHRVEFKQWREKRSLDANSQYYVWLPVCAKHYGEPVEFIRKWMKHDLAWPILERGQSDYAKKVRYMLGKSNYYNLSFKQQVEMIDMFKITSLMDSAQHCQLRDELQVFWAKQGLQLNYLNNDTRT